ncbi:TlpA family protein disulfide reductase [Marinifilum breve]|nr:thioredoxin-like domain-containing protein [Marinifilum breve]
MKKIFLTLIISSCMIGSNLAQTSKKACKLSNSLYKLWDKGKIDKATELSLELYRIDPPMLVERIHNTLAFQIKNDPNQYRLKYFEKLYNEDNQEINKIIAPMYLWSKTVNTNNKTVLKSIVKELNSLLKDSSNYNSRAERYYILILNELAEKNSIDNKTRENLIIRIIQKLETYSFLVDIPSNRKESKKRAWHRYILAFCYDYLYTNIDHKEEYLKMASDYSPDLNDRLYESTYFYDANILNENGPILEFKTKYQKYIANNNSETETLDLLSEIAFSNPSENNIEALQECFVKINSDGEFKTYWEKYVNGKGKAVPAVTIKFENEELDLTKKSDEWIYIDVWGTWCKPCCKELPQLQSFYLANQDVSNSKLKIYTLSFGSKNLSNFMSKNKYTFPVSEIDKKTNNLFEISAYPTKILITPSGNYIKIPHGVNWKMYIENYTLMN